MTNLKILEIKQTIQTYVKQVELPDVVKRMVLADILSEQEAITLETLKREIKEIEEREKTEKEETEHAESSC